MDSALLRSLAIGLLLIVTELSASALASRMEVVADVRGADFNRLISDRLPSWKRVELPSSKNGAPAGPYAHVSESHYVLPDGRSVMLSIAYGANQLNDRFHAHRPEYCYKAQGFDIIEIADSQLKLQGRTIPVRRMVAVNKNRIERVTYWMSISDRVALPGWDRKLAQLESALHGKVPDGYLVRISTIGGDPKLAEALQRQFLDEWLESLPEQSRRHLIGSQPG